VEEKGVWFESISPGLWSLGRSIMPVLDASMSTLLARGVPGFLPAFVAHGIAHGEHGMDGGTFPSQTAAFQVSLTHERVGALHHARTHRPARSWKERRGPEGEPCAQLAHMLANGFLIGFRFCHTSCHQGQGSWAAMHEEREASVEQASRKPPTIRAQGLQPFPQVFSRMRNIEKPESIPAMDFHERVQPIRSIHHRTDLVGLDHLTATGLDVCHIGNVGGIGQAGERGEVPDVDVLWIGWASWNLPHGQRADVCPFSPGQWD
jgi:hypothetical protein